MYEIWFLWCRCESNQIPFFPPIPQQQSCIQSNWTSSWFSTCSQPRDQSQLKSSKWIMWMDLPCHMLWSSWVGSVRVMVRVRLACVWSTPKLHLGNSVMLVLFCSLNHISFSKLYRTWPLSWLELTSKILLLNFRMATPKYWSQLISRSPV